MVKRAISKRKPKNKILPRRSKVGLAAAPTDSFRWFCDYFRMEIDKKDLANISRAYIKKNYKGTERTLLLSGPDYFYTGEAGVTATIEWIDRGFIWPEYWNGNRKIAGWISRIKLAIENKAIVKEEFIANRKPPMEIVKEKNSDFIAQIENILDQYDTMTQPDWDQYSVYNEMIKLNLSASGSKGVVDYYTPLKNELEELINIKTPDLVEAYAHAGKIKQKRLLKFITAVIDDANRYSLSKKATRKTSKPVVKSAGKQVSKLNFAQSGHEFKIASINPSNIVGAHRLYTFNTKYRIITEYVSEKTGGFEVRGSTLYGIDMALSRSVRLRKPEESLTIFLTKTHIAVNKFWATLTTKTSGVVNGRINKDTIILRVLDK